MSSSLFSRSQHKTDSKNKKAAIESMKDPLLSLVLDHLPHLQLNEAVQSDLWTKISTKVLEALDDGTKTIIDQTFTSRETFAKDVFNMLMEAFIAANSFEKGRIEDEHLKWMLVKETDLVMWELYKLRYLDVDIKAMNSKARYLVDSKIYLDVEAQKFKSQAAAGHYVEDRKADSDTSSLKQQ